MRYVERNLTEGERIIYTTRRHWIVLVVPALMAIGIGLIGIALLFRDGESRIVGFTMLGLAGLTYLVGWLRRYAFEFDVTNKRVVYRKGILTLSTDELFLAKIESVLVTQGLIGRWFDYGTVTVRGIGGSWEPFRLVAQPLMLRRRIQEQAEMRAAPANA